MIATFSTELRPEPWSYFAEPSILTTGIFPRTSGKKAERVEVQRRTYDKQRAEIAKMEDFVRRYHYGDRHAQAEDRKKKLERIELVEPPSRRTGESPGSNHRDDGDVHDGARDSCDVRSGDRSAGYAHDCDDGNYGVRDPL